MNRYEAISLCDRDTESTRPCLLSRDTDQVLRPQAVEAVCFVSQPLDYRKFRFGIRHCMLFLMHTVEERDDCTFNLKLLI